MCLKVNTSFGNAPLSKNEIEALITNHVKEYVLTIFAGRAPTN